MSASKCKSCGAEIVWAEIEGKRIPLNQRRVRAYAPHQGVYHELKAGPRPSPEPLLVHISHFVTCPNAAEHSRGKK